MGKICCINMMSGEYTFVLVPKHVRDQTGFLPPRWFQIAAEAAPYDRAFCVCQCLAKIVIEERTDTTEHDRTVLLPGDVGGGVVVSERMLAFGLFSLYRSALRVKSGIRTLLECGRYNDVDAMQGYLFVIAHRVWMLTVNGHPAVTPTEEEPHPPCLGTTDWEKNAIYVSSVLNHRALMSTVAHEIAHAVSGAVGFKDSMDERLADMIAMAVLALAREDVRDLIDNEWQEEVR